MNTIISNEGSLILNGGTSTVPKGMFACTVTEDIVNVFYGDIVHWKLDYKTTTVDSAECESAKELASLLSSFSRGGGDGQGVTWENITDKPAVIAAGNDAAGARSAIGAGTSNLAIGTTSTTAKRGDYEPSWSNVSDKPSSYTPSAHTHSEYVQTSRTINSKPLTDNINLNPADLSGSGLNISGANAMGLSTSDNLMQLFNKFVSRMSFGVVAVTGNQLLNNNHTLKTLSIESTSNPTLTVFDGTLNQIGDKIFILARNSFALVVSAPATILAPSGVNLNSISAGNSRYVIEKIGNTEYWITGDFA